MSGIPRQILKDKLVRAAAAGDDDRIVAGVENIVARSAGKRLARSIVRGEGSSRTGRWRRRRRWGQWGLWRRAAAKHACRRQSAGRDVIECGDEGGPRIGCAGTVGIVIDLCATGAIGSELQITVRDRIGTGVAAG